MSIIPILTFISTLFFVLISANSIINKEVNRVIDASEAIVRESIEIKFEKSSDDSKNNYKLAFTDQQASRLAFLSVTSKNKKLSVSQPET